MQDLSQIKGTYTYELALNRERLFRMCDDYEISLDQLKTTVLKVIEPASNNRTKLDFINKIRNFKEKEQLIYIITNSLLAVEGLAVLKD